MWVVAGAAGLEMFWFCEASQPSRRVRRVEMSGCFFVGREGKAGGLVWGLSRSHCLGESYTKPFTEHTPWKLSPGQRQK